MNSYSCSIQPEFTVHRPVDTDSVDYIMILLNAHNLFLIWESTSSNQLDSTGTGSMLYFDLANSF